MTSFAHLPILPVILPLLSGIVLLALRNRSLSPPARAKTRKDMTADSIRRAAARRSR